MLHDRTMLLPLTQPSSKTKTERSPNTIQARAKHRTFLPDHQATMNLEFLSIDPTPLENDKPFQGLCRPCVDCGLMTGSFCDGLTVNGKILDNCFAEQRFPSEVWCANQRTPFCSQCERKRPACHFCLQTPTCQPPPINVYEGQPAFAEEIRRDQEG